MPSKLPCDSTQKRFLPKLQDFRDNVRRGEGRLSQELPKSFLLGLVEGTSRADFAENLISPCFGSIIAVQVLQREIG